jgi:SSS family transporter
MPAPSGFQALDWAVLAIYALVLAGTAAVVSRRPRDADAYFVGERSMPVWAVALSVVATALSAATFIGAPEQSFSGDLAYLSANLGAIIAVLVVGWRFIPAFYRERVVTVYELIGNRFGRPAAMASSWTFLVGRVFASGSRLFIAATPLALLVSGDGLATTPGQLMAAIAMIAAIGTVYALVGGIASVIWTDVVQMVVLLGATLAALVLLLHRIPLDPGAIVSLLADTRVGQTATHAGHSKLAVISLDLSPGSAFTLFTALTGWTLFNLAAYGTDQDLAQRMLTCRSAVAGGRSALLAIVAGIPVSLLFMVIGLLLYVFYARPEAMGAAAPGYPPPKPSSAFLVFILREMPAGLRGLMMAGLFAVAFASLLSALNAMASATLNDIYRPLAGLRGLPRDARRELLVGRLAVVGWGVVLALFACLCVWWQQANGETLIEFALGVMSFAYAGLLAVFLTALFTARGNSASAIAALLTGFAAVGAMQPAVWKAWTGGVTLASPWRLVIATALAFAVCCLGRRDAAAPGAARAASRAEEAAP